MPTPSLSTPASSLAAASDRISRLEVPDPAQRREERRAAGKAARDRSPRRLQGEWSPAPERPDPVDLLGSQNASRFPDLVPVRWGRMAASPFTFYRGSAALMAFDLAGTPDSGLVTQVCGDAHLQNFGLFASPERRLLFDLNDFDETLPGPWEWDVKRLVTSIVLAVRDGAGSLDDQTSAARAAVERYRTTMAFHAGQTSTEVWYSKVDVDDALESVVDEHRAATEKMAAKARRRDTLQALDRLTEVVDGHRRIVDDPPLVEHREELLFENDIHAMIDEYRSTLADERRLLFDRFTIVDIARKVVGVGSVGTHCWIALGVADREEDDPLFLQIKEASRSVLEPFVGRSAHANHGQRVVVGQRMMQAASDVFLGWMANADGRHFYVRQLRDMKGSVRTETMSSSELSAYGATCAAVLARAHARTGDPSAIAGYMGSGDAFDRAIVAFAGSYADQAERDHAALRSAIDDGRIEALEGV